MAKKVNLPPKAYSLIASLRDIGYSFETAVADLIDNSISANAKNIDIHCLSSGDEPVFALIDDGEGMSGSYLRDAMRHGSTSPAEVRKPSDLGRFGLGLKTASFSQCRRLTVATAQHGKVNAAEWDLQQIEREDDWLISEYEEAEISGLPFIDELGSNGTLVLWRDIDRMFGDEQGDKRDEIANEKLDILEKHLSLVFHRFLAGDANGKCNLSIRKNGHRIEAFDPFMRQNKATQMLAEEVIRFKGSEIVMRPYILPHHSKLSLKEFSFYSDRSDFLSNQGAYIYRNRRLLAWGDWFRLMPKAERTKLARVQIDFDNSMDESWTIDIKKSRATPPPQVRDRLKQVIGQIENNSVSVYRRRGGKLVKDVEMPIWERHVDCGTIKYALNREHPLAKIVYEVLEDRQDKAVDVFLDSVESSLPIDLIYSDYSSTPQQMKQNYVDEDDLTQRLEQLATVLFGKNDADIQFFRDVVESSGILKTRVEVLERFIKEKLQ